MTEALVCWKCGAPLAGVPLPLSRRAECPACHAELHVCRLCRYYDTRINGQCTEDRAEEVREKERANFCDYFKPKAGAYTARGAKTRAAQAAVDALFGGTPESGADASKSDATRDRLDQMFKAPGKNRD
jgi:hypothetical protein